MSLFTDMRDRIAHHPGILSVGPRQYDQLAALTNDANALGLDAETYLAGIDAGEITPMTRRERALWRRNQR